MAVLTLRIAGGTEPQLREDAGSASRITLTGLKGMRER